jgi:hypothetical protein
MTMPLRSFSWLALSSSALRNFPGRCSMRTILPRTGARLMCTEKTFMNTEIRVISAVPRLSSRGGTAGPTAETTPSAGLITSLSSTGVTRSGSR